MGLFGNSRSEIRYDMFDMERSAAEAKRFTRCENLYHRGQALAWDGKTILPMLIEKHGGIHVTPAQKKALKEIFAIILWGELAAWKISAQLADELVPLEAKMAATGQAFDEARHFYTMYDYLRELDYVPERMDRPPQALLDLVLGTHHLAHKLIGMQLMVETIALAIFQSIRESEVEPVLCELMTYFERDEARHVGLGMQYLPELIKDMGSIEVARMTLFQVRLLVFAIWENKALEPDYRVLGIDPRQMVERARRKQMAALQSAYKAIGVPLDREDNPANRLVSAAVEGLFPVDPASATPYSRMRAAWAALRTRGVEEFDVDEFAEHERHRIQLATGKISGGGSENGDRDAVA